MPWTCTNPECDWPDGDDRVFRITLHKIQDGHQPVWEDERR